MNNQAESQRKIRLQRLALELGTVLPANQGELSPPKALPTYLVPDDQRKADAILGQLKIEEAANKPQPKGLRKLSTRTSKSSTPTYDDLYAALTRAINDNVGAGVVEALLSRFQNVAGNINLARRASGGVIRKIRNTDNREERGKLLHTATEISRYDFVQLLAPLADQLSLDESLQCAIGKRDLRIIETLLSYGSNTALYEEQFDNTVKNGDSEFLDLWLRARKPVSEQCITRNLLTATKLASLPMVLRLLQAGANGDHDSASALMQAVNMDRDDIAVAILISQRPPSSDSLDKAIRHLFSAPPPILKGRCRLLEIILCGGSMGVAANDGLFTATTLGHTDMMNLLLQYNADVNHNDAAAVRCAIQQNRSDLVSVLLQKRSLLPSYASGLVQFIPRTSPSTDKMAILSKLLVNGAAGTHCSELLISSVEQDDIDTAHLLVSYGKNENNPVCSVDYNGSRSVQLAVSRNNLAMVKILALQANPSKFSLAKALASLPTNLSENDEFLMVQVLLKGGATGPEVRDLLHTVVVRPNKSPRLIDLLVQFGASISSETFYSAVSQGSAEMIRKLLAGTIPPSTFAGAINVAMKLQHGTTRFEIIGLLVGPATAERNDVAEISQAVIEVVQNCPDDSTLLTLLCREGKANVNYENGTAIALATDFDNPRILDTMLRGEGQILTPSTVTLGLGHAIALPHTDKFREWKVKALLTAGKPQEAIDQALIKEVQSHLAQRHGLSVLQVLLDAGANVNAQDCAPMCLAAPEPAILDLLLKHRPSQEGLSRAFSSGAELRSETRYSLYEQLLHAGATGSEISKALCIVLKEGSPEIRTIKLLLPHSDVNFKDGRPLRVAVRGVFIDAIDLLLDPQHCTPSVASRTGAVQEAIKLKVKDARLRLLIVQKLLNSGKVEEPVISDALITAVNTTDLTLVDLLLSYGASVEYKSGSAILSAASSGHCEILELLVSGRSSSKPTLSSLTSGFGGATSLREKEKNTYSQVLQILLNAGMKGEALDIALAEAVKEGDSNLALSSILYQGGASLEWQDGEALDIATRSASIETLKLLLEDHPSQRILVRLWRSAIQLARDSRLQVIELLLNAGKAIDKHVSRALTAATLETPSDRALVKLLLDRGAFDNGESITYTAKILDLKTLSILLSSPKAKEFISPSFKDVMSTEDVWKSTTGFAVAEMLLRAGASGDVVAEALCRATERCQEEDDILMTKFVEVLLRFGADVNYQRGKALQTAVMQANLPIVEMLRPTATSDTKAVALPHLFKNSNTKDKVVKALESFEISVTGTAEGLDVITQQDPAFQPVMFLALDMFPRDVEVLESLLRLGYSPNQWQMSLVNGIDQPWPILCWALDQHEKRISSAVIEVLIGNGANITFTTKTGITPLTLAIQNQRADIVSKLISKGANVTTANPDGITPLVLASSLNNTAIMDSLLHAGAEINDGSLHDVSRNLHVEAMRTLIKHGHHVDYPSDRHDGRSALAELCIRAVNASQSPTPARLEEAIQCLVANDADIRLRDVSGKTIFHYALDSANPTLIITVLLKLLWQIINEDVFLFSDSTYTYSLTKYITKGLSPIPPHQHAATLQLLRNKRAKDRFWAHSLDAIQPPDYCNPPEHIASEILVQKARQKRLKEQQEDALALLALKKATAKGEVEILQSQAAAENAISVEKSRLQQQLMTERANTQLQLELATERERDRLTVSRQARDVRHQKQLGDIQLSTQRTLTQEAIEGERTKQAMAIEYTERKQRSENDGTRARLAIEGSARAEEDKVLARQHERELARLKMTGKLVEKQTMLAGTVQAGARGNAAQRQIGFVTE